MEGPGLAVVCVDRSVVVALDCCEAVGSAVVAAVVVLVPPSPNKSRRRQVTK